METIAIFASIGLTVLVIFLLLRLNRQDKSLRQLQDKYKSIIDVENYINDIKKQAEQAISEKNSKLKATEEQIEALRATAHEESKRATEEKERKAKSLQEDINKLQSDYSIKRNYFDKLTKEVLLYEEEQEVMSYGLYKPHFDFDTSEKYKAELLSIREKEKALIIGLTQRAFS